MVSSLNCGVHSTKCAVNVNVNVTDCHRHRHRHRRSQIRQTGPTEMAKSSRPEHAPEMPGMFTVWAQRDRSLARR